MCFVHMEIVDIFFCDPVFQMSNIEMIRYVVPPQYRCAQLYCICALSMCVYV